MTEVTTTFPLTIGTAPPPTPVSSPPAVGAADGLGYKVQGVLDFTKGEPAGLFTYGTQELPPSGWISDSHISYTAAGLVIKGYVDPSIGPGCVGAGLNTNAIADMVVPTGGDGFDEGGFDLYGSYSPNNWTPNGGSQGVHAVPIGWPEDNVWGDGEVDISEGSPTFGFYLNVHEIGSDPSNVWTQIVGDNGWPSALGNGSLHLQRVRWDHTNGYRVWLDEATEPFFTLPIGQNGATCPTVGKMLTAQMQDTGNNFQPGTEDNDVPASDPLVWTIQYAVCYVPVGLSAETQAAHLAAPRPANFVPTRGPIRRSLAPA